MKKIINNTKWTLLLVVLLTLAFLVIFVGDQTVKFEEPKNYCSEGEMFEVELCYFDSPFGIWLYFFAFAVIPGSPVIILISLVLETIINNYRNKTIKKSK